MMKVKALIDCQGVGYDLKTGDEAELDKGLAEKLIRFGYVEGVKTTRKPPKEKVKE